MPECVMLIASAKILAGKKMWFKLALNKTSCLILYPLTYQRLKDL